jgi:hypothetical protein
LIFGLYRSSTALPILTEMKAITGCDHIIPVASLLDGKFAYAPETTYLRRMVHPKDSDQNYMERIAGANAAEKMSRDYSEAGKQMFNWIQKHREQQNLSREQEKTYKALLFQMAWKFDTPTGNPFWDSIFFLRERWRKHFKIFKCKFVPGYAKRKGL